ncbi:hypothetical protein EDD92_1389 [Streptomyces sp. TLI_185]|nr:hypothetical protein EDD92_1389 [Streptomyces sp. TLI_185]
MSRAACCPATDDRAARRAGPALLRKAQRDGHGHTRVFSIPRSYAHQLLTNVGPAKKAGVFN